MFLEIAQIEVKPGLEAEFEAGVAKPAPLLKRAKGCSEVELQRFGGEAVARSALRALADGGEPHPRLPRLGRLSGMAQARQPLLHQPTRSGASAEGRGGVLMKGDGEIR